MTVEKTFWADPYLTTLITKVTSISANVITLDRTIIFPFSGGQTSDSGTIGGYEVIKAEKIDREIYYTIPTDHHLTPGQDVLLQIDWEQRYKVMRLHFAAEIILELVYRHYNHPEKVGANITVTKARIDFVWDGNISETFSFLHSEFNRLVAANLPIVSDYTDIHAEERYWEINGFGKVPCGGTHIKFTGEIGPIKLKRDNIGRNKERIEITLLNILSK